MNTRITRRSLLAAGLGVAVAGPLSACTSSGAGGSGMGDMPGMSHGGTSAPSSATARLIAPDSATVAAVEAKRRSSGRTVKVSLTAASGTVDLAGTVARTWMFDDRLPGPVIRLSAGDVLDATVANHLPAPTAVHWHGLALRNDMDGVPPVTQRAIAAGGSFRYRFLAERPGTYWFHPHVGVQLDRGLYGAMIVEDPREPLAYDDEWVVVLDDWLDGVTGTPDDALAELSAGMGGTGAMGHMDSAGDTGAMGTRGTGTGSPSAPAGSGARLMLMGATSELLGGDAGDVRYPYHLVNGRPAHDPETFRGRPNRRIRIRLVNAGSDTAYRVALGGHRLTVTHADGYPVRHQQADAVLIGPGERYDVLVTLGSGVFPLTALAEGKGQAGRALVRTGPGTAPRVGARPGELDGRIVAASRLRAAEEVQLPTREPDITHRIRLTGGMEGYDWSLDGQKFDMTDPTAHPFTVREGRRVRLTFVNRTAMWHPMHLHGHTFRLGAAGPRKDTALVLPGQTVSCDFDADNPGRWLVHCHNAYHGEAGMMGLLGYLA
ncbi:multicopper oxidase family protein [Streptacidiphilus monticola]|uniref:Multicopper oxidase family protein n=1 Tax=Streptacidiphilus monticola TaxID=2161674 RepID=A0ABW1G9A9_9ACTN